VVYEMCFLFQVRHPCFIEYKLKYNIKTYII